MSEIDAPLTASRTRAPAARIFVSYARTDATKANEIAAGLRFGGFEVLIDEESIERGEAWQTKLDQLIASADTVVFLLSPKFTASTMCAWELSRAQHYAKRLAPVLLENAPEAPAALAALNYVRFDEGRSFMAGLQGLCTALKVDLGWIRDHTRLQQRAIEWDAAGRPENRLLFDEDVRVAEDWLVRANSDVPPVTNFQRAYVSASISALAKRKDVERARLREVGEAQARRAIAQQRFGWALAAISMLVVGGALLAGYQARRNAVDEERVQTQFARLQMEQGRYTSAVRLAVVGLKAGEAPWRPRRKLMEAMLRSAASLDPHLASAPATEIGAEALREKFRKRGLETKEILSLAAAANRIVQEEGWPPAMGTVAIRFPSGALGLRYDRSSGLMELIRVGEPEARIARLEGHGGEILHAAVAPAEGLIATVGADGVVLFWETQTGANVGRLEEPADRIGFDESGRYLVTVRGKIVGFFGLQNLIRVARPGVSLEAAYIVARGEGVILRGNQTRDWRLYSPAHGVFNRAVAVSAPPSVGASVRWEDVSLAEGSTSGVPPASGIVCGGDQAVTPLWKELSAGAVDWGVHPDGSMIAIAFPKGGARILDPRGNVLAELLDFGVPFLDLEFDCAGKRLTSIDAAGRYSEWDLQPLLVPRADLWPSVCSGHLQGAATLTRAEAAFVDRSPDCDR